MIFSVLISPMAEGMTARMIGRRRTKKMDNLAIAVVRRRSEGKIWWKKVEVETELNHNREEGKGLWEIKTW